MGAGAETPQDELTRIRALLRPPPIPGADDWGIPPEPTGACDPEIEVRLLFCRFYLGVWLTRCGISIGEAGAVS